VILATLFRLCVQNVPGRFGEVLLSKPTGKRSRVRPRTKWCDYISDLAWSRLGVELENYLIAADHAAFRVLLWLFPQQPSLEENRYEKE